MKSDIYSSIKKYLKIAISISLIIMICYFVEYNIVYNNIRIESNGVKTLEYGSGNYNIKDLIKNDNGEEISIKKDVDINKIGKQEIILEARMGDVVKEIPVKVEVKDTTAPDIKIKNKNISLEVGDDFDLLNNLESVSDKSDNNIKYLSNVDESNDTDYYTVYGKVNSNVPGVYPVTVKAVDKYGNLSSVTYKVEVKRQVQIINNDEEKNEDKKIYNNDYVAKGDTNGLVKMAYSLVGSRYVAGGADPSVGFDCSGFVYYLYSQIGISVSRSSSTQINDGVAVSYDQAKPGDILSWGYVDGSPTHSALYVGNGKMIHATNPATGVIVSDVAAWTRGSGSHVIAVRRI